MRLGVSLCTLALVFAAGASPAAAQLPALPDVIETVEETTKKVVEDTKKAVEDTERAVREVVDRTVHPPAPDPGGGSGGGPGGGGGPGDNPGGGGPGDDDGPGDGGGDDGRPVDEDPGDDDSGGGPGGGRGSDDGGSGPGAKDGQGLRETSGVLGGGEGGAALVVARPLASSDRVPPARPGGGSDLLAGDTRDVQPSFGAVAAAKAGPFVLAVLALALVCLVVGTGGGLRALHGRLRGA